MIYVYLPKIFQPFKCNTMIRLGKDYDGGYLINNNDISQTKNLISFGVGEDFSFETDFLIKNRCNCFTYDGTVDGLLLKKYDIVHCQKNVGISSDEINVSSILSDKQDVFLKCDIENNEYFILNDLITHSSKFTGLVIEFHDVCKKNNYEQISNFIAKIDQKLIHTHINNYTYYKFEKDIIPSVLELTFTSSRNISFDPLLQLPHVLDMPNNLSDNHFGVVFV